MVLGSFALLKTTAHLQWCSSLCLPDEGSFPQCHHHTMVCLTALHRTHQAFHLIPHVWLKVVVKTLCKAGRKKSGV